MRYIGPFFRMNSLSYDEICGQLFHLSKEAVKLLALSSKCGYTLSSRSAKKIASTKDISILSKFSPVLCLYKKSSPLFMHNKTSNGFDSSSFKREVIPATNALMTMCLLELSDYYSCLSKNSGDYKLAKGYRALAHEQLDFYYENLRNSEGIFISKKSLFENNTKESNLIDKDRKFAFSDQAFMMNAYYLYSKYEEDEKTKKDYEEFSLQILQMFLDYKEALYNLSFEEGLKTLLAFNIYYKNSKNEDMIPLIIDLSEFMCNKFDEKNYYLESLDLSSLLAIALMYSYEHTNLATFKDKYCEIMDKLISLYDENNNIIENLTNKKEIKYTSFDICFYLLSIIMYANKCHNIRDYNKIISRAYKKYVLNSNIVTSWPEAPDLDNEERYINFSSLSKDMLNETFFRMPNLPSLSSTGMAPIFLKNIVYSRKKQEFKIPSKKTFDSYKNMFIYFMFINCLKEEFFKKLNLIKDIKVDYKVNSINELENLESDSDISVSYDNDIYVDNVDNMDNTSNIDNIDNTDTDISVNFNIDNTDTNISVSSDIDTDEIPTNNENDTSKIEDDLQKDIED